MRWVDMWRLARPGNAAMAAAGVVVGGVLFAGRGAHVDSLFYCALAAVLGVAGGNALNDVRDARVDARAHPGRPIPRGTTTRREAAEFAVAAMVMALAVAWLANALVGVGAAVLLAGLVAYEFRFKAQGLAGNLWISAVVASTLLLGALAAPFSPRTYDLSMISSSQNFFSWGQVAAVAALAWLSNVAREVFKDVEDFEADRWFRRTLPVRIGAKRAMGVGRWFLAAAVVLVVPALFWLWRGEANTVWRFVVVLPPLAVFMVALSKLDAGSSQRWTKAGMAAALFAFFVIGII